MSTQLRAGSASVKFTPSMNMHLLGSFERRPCERIADDPYAHVLMIEDGTKEIALISVDVCMLPCNYPFPVFKAISEKTGIDENYIFVSATHTHTSVTLDIKQAPENVDFITGVWQDIVTAVAKAQSNKKNVRIGACSRANKEFLHNRRFEGPDGMTVQNWADNETLKQCIESGVIDPEVLVYKLVDDDRKEVAFIVNYSMHNNAYQGKELTISADFSGVICNILKSVYGQDTAVIYMGGAAGDTNCYDNFFKFPMGDMWQDRHLFVGRSLAGTILGMDAFYEFPKNTEITASNETIKINERPYRPIDDVVDMTFGKPERVQHIWDSLARGKKHWEETQGGRLETHDFPIGVITFGQDLAVVTVAGELFVELGLKIKEQSPYKHTMIWQLTNGFYGYIPTKEAFDKGGYEVRKNGLYSCLVEEAGDMIVDYAIKKLRKFKEES